MSAFLSIWAGLRVKAPMRMDFSTKSWCRSQGQWRSITSKSLDIAAGKPTYSSPPASGGKRALYGRLPCLPICGRRRAARSRPVIKNFQAQDDFIHSGLLQDHGIVSLVNVPVLIEGAAWGVLEVDSTRPRDFSQDTTDMQ
jgi:GAF domain-containing protein